MMLYLKIIKIKNYIIKYLGFDGFKNFSINFNEKGHIILDFFGLLRGKICCLFNYKVFLINTLK